MADLGGLRSRQKSVAPETNAFWDNESFHNYADYALSAQFHAGLEHLLDEGRKRRCAIMCSEAVWWRCHRRIVATILSPGGNPFSTLWDGAAWSLPALLRALSFNPVGQSPIPPRIDRTHEW